MKGLALAEPTRATADVAGVPFIVTNLDEAALRVLAMAHGQEKAEGIRLANAYSVVVANSDPAYSTLMKTSGSNYPDGAPVVACMRILEGSNGAGRVRGPSFFRRTIEFGIEQGTRHFFLGTTPETLVSLESNLRSLYPAIQIAGSYAPPFAPLDADLVSACLKALEGKEPHIVWVGMGSPKQDFIAAEIVAALDIPSAGVGAAFDFISGAVAEAPKWVQTVGLEWFFRLISDPKRLWKRYLVGNVRFLLMVGSTVARRLYASRQEKVLHSGSRSDNR
jgi:N-acetylglucosaminyldiphosphoundecaprenol N-acetyl-beta-D-mannosaminyltransferase